VARIAGLVFATIALAGCQQATQGQAPGAAPSTTPQVAAASRAPTGLPVPRAPQPATPGALPAGQFRTEGGTIVPARTFWQGMGPTVMGRLVPASNDGRLQSQASVWVNGPNVVEVLEWWRTVSPSSAIIEIDGVPMANLPCQRGRGGPHLQCYDTTGDFSAAERVRAAMRSGQTLRVIFMSGNNPQSEASFSLAGFRA
jgi:hypothetical protein